MLIRAHCPACCGPRCHVTSLRLPNSVMTYSAKHRSCEYHITSFALSTALQGSATLSMAYAGALFADACLRGLNGDSNVVEPTFVQSTVTELPFFASKVRLGPSGATISQRPSAKFATIQVVKARFHLSPSGCVMLRWRKLRR